MKNGQPELLFLHLVTVLSLYLTKTHFCDIPTKENNPPVIMTTVPRKKANANSVQFGLFCVRNKHAATLPSPNSRTNRKRQSFRALFRRLNLIRTQIFINLKLLTGAEIKTQTNRCRQKLIKTRRNENRLTSLCAEYKIFVNLRWRPPYTFR